MSLEFQNISQTLNGQVILDNVSLKIDTQEIVFLCGKSGTGKSVLLKTLTGFLIPQDGDILIHGISIFHPISAENQKKTFKDLKKLRSTCAIIFQNSALIDGLTIFENIAFGIRDWDLEVKKKKVHEILDLMKISRNLLPLQPFEIAHGLKKKIAIARALAINPSILLFDEPTTSLDPINTNIIDDLILTSSRALKMTILVVSHDMRSALKIAHRIIFLDEGKIIAEHTPQNIYDTKNLLVLDFLSEITL